MRTNRPIGSAAFLGSAIALGIAFILVYYAAVRTRTGQLLDTRAFDGARLGQRSLAPVTLSLLDSLPVVVIVIALVIALVVTAFRHNWRVLFVAAAAALAANLATQLLKDAVLERPSLGVPGYAFNSLPSGHTTVAASAALVVFLVASPRARALVAAIGTAFTVAAGVSTLSNQWHRPSDVIAALLVVACCGCLAGAALTLIEPPSIPITAGPAWTRILRWLALLSLAATALAAAASATLAADRSLSLSLAYIAGVAAISAAGFVLASAASRAFRSFP
jgi:membrane-associated phospholipid phosphatase